MFEALIWKIHVFRMANCMLPVPVLEKCHPYLFTHQVIKLKNIAYYKALQ